MARYTFLFLMVSLSVSSCVKSEALPHEIGLDYQPLAEGQSWIYEVKEIDYYGEENVEPQIYFLKDLIYSTYNNKQNKPIYLVQRLQSFNRIDWQINSTYTLRIENNFLLRNVENKVLTCLRFPVRDNDSWDGNIYNTASENLFFTKLLIDHTVGKLNFNDVMMVIHKDEDDLITIKDHQYEIYAQGFGMVESYYEVLNYCSLKECLGEQRIESGRLTHIKMLSYE